MKILLGYHYHVHPVDVRQSIENYCAGLRENGVHMECFPITLNPPGPKLSVPQLDALWKRGDRTLFKMYEALAARLENFDVFLNWGAYNLHPDFLASLRMPKVCAMFDDPEQWDAISRHMAPHYDMSLVGNAAELERYRKNGIRAEFWPLGFRDSDQGTPLTREDILKDDRDVTVTILCERDHSWRRERLDRIASAFPEGRYHGLGWNTGFLPDEERIPLLRRTKIGINIHNSTGPLNSRTYSLPANGVLQICDNKQHLHHVFEVGKEIVGFDTIDEAIELTHYYLAHEEERRQIAAAGWERSVRDYNYIALARRAVETMRPLVSAASEKVLPEATWLAEIRSSPSRKFQRMLYAAAGPIRFAQSTLKWARRLAGSLVRKCLGRGIRSAQGT
jgi:spore maturation protein CgeB